MQKLLNIKHAVVENANFYLDQDGVRLQRNDMAEHGSGSVTGMLRSIPSVSCVLPVAARENG